MNFSKNPYKSLIISVFMADCVLNGFKNENVFVLNVCVLDLCFSMNWFVGLLCDG
jgi:hypothetical protein